MLGVATSGDKPGLHLLAEIAQGPGHRVIRRLDVHKPELKPGGNERQYPWLLGYSTWNHRKPLLPTLGLLIPTHPEIAARIYTFEEALQWQLDFIGEFPGIGRVPTQFVIKTRCQPELFKALGYRGYPEGTIENNLGDEIAIHVTISKDEQNRRFREFARAQGLDPLDLIADDQVDKAKQLDEGERWELVTIRPALPGKPKHFYESANFLYRLWYEELDAKRRDVEQKYPDKIVLSGANFSPHMNVWPDVRQWVEPFRDGSMSMTWTEDWWWQVPEASPQVYGFLLDAFRLARTYHGAPAQFYIMPFQGNSPDNFRKMNALAAAHGVKIFNHFVTDSQVMVTWDYVSVMDSPRTYQAIHDVIRDLGAVEHRLYPAMPKPAQIAILLSRASDTWDTEDLGGAGHLYSAKYNVNNDERKAIWLALRHAQYPVDLITDQDIADGRLESYKVLYVVGSEMLRAAAEPLKQWVAAGGTVYATAGGGLLDEYRKPLTELFEMYGLASHDLVRHRRHIRPRNTLKQVEARDVLRIKPLGAMAAGLALPAYLYRETLEPRQGAVVVGTYRSDGSAGVVTNSFGKGKTIYCGVLAGIAYLQPAMTASAQILPTAFPAQVRQLIASAAHSAPVSRPVIASDPLVETQYFTGPQGDMVVLINWHDVPVKDLVLRFPGRDDLGSVRSLRQAGYFRGHLHAQERGRLQVSSPDGIGQVKLDLGVSDYLLLD
jgi:hypothetical protein